MLRSTCSRAIEKPCLRSNESCIGPPLSCIFERLEFGRSHSVSEPQNNSQQFTVEAKHFASLICEPELSPRHTQLTLEGPQRRVGVVGPVTPSRARQAILFMEFHGISWICGRSRGKGDKSPVSQYIPDTKVLYSIVQIISNYKHVTSRYIIGSRESFAYFIHKYPRLE